MSDQTITRRSKATHRKPGPWRPEGCDRVAMVLQGGGALGAYQAGVYEAMHEAGLEPDWVCGVSIGAINSAIIAGNDARDRLPRLREFWETISDRKIWAFTPDGDIFRKARNAHSSMLTMMAGQPGFFAPRQVNPWTALTGSEHATSFYESDPLRETLVRLVDFDRLNHGPVHFAVGAVNVLSGNFIFFDNQTEDIEPEHIMASGALPPALPMVKIGTDYFWDGGIVSNTPLRHLLDHDETLNTLVFQVDLFSARGQLPRDMPEVLARHKDIMYSSRTRANTETYRKIRRWKQVALDALAKVPEERLDDEQRKIKATLLHMPDIVILQMIYQQKTYEGHAKDYDFSGTSMRDHWSSGYEDTRRVLKHRQWLEMPAAGAGIVVHDVHREYD